LREATTPQDAARLFVLATRSALAYQYSCHESSVRTLGGVASKTSDRVVVTASHREGSYWKVTVVINPEARDAFASSIYVIRDGDHYVVC
jgi:hypothetical protein